MEPRLRFDRVCSLKLKGGTVPEPEIKICIFTMFMDAKISFYGSCECVSSNVDNGFPNHLVITVFLECP